VASSPDVIVIGAGVLGLCVAAELAGRGHAVTVIDPGGVNASAVAAGMIAPAMESLIESLPAETAALLTRARDQWPAFAEAHTLNLKREGAEWRGPDAAEALACLKALSFKAEATQEGVFTPDDWRIDPTSALTALARTPGVATVRGKVARLTGEARRWRVEAEDGRVWFTPTVVLATGVGAVIEGLPGSVAALVEAITPIKGQLTVLPGVSTPHVVRNPVVYAAPCEGGVVVGATMQVGERDLTPDPQAGEAHLASGKAMLGVTTASGVMAGATRVGVRGASPDGLAIAGATAEPGLHLALAPRRNGWLLGPLIAHVVADGIEGATPSFDAAAFDPLRFSPPAG
jgi:glycine oxidase